MTATQSDVVPSLLDGLSSGPQDWYYWASVLYHNGRELSSNLPHLWDLNTNQKVGFLLSSNGDLHIYLDGQHIIKAASGLPVGKSLWGAVDVYGSCTKIKSELLNGKINWVCMQVCLCVLCSSANLALLYKAQRECCTQ